MLESLMIRFDPIRFDPPPSALDTRARAREATGSVFPSSGSARTPLSGGRSCSRAESRLEHRLPLASLLLISPLCLQLQLFAHPAARYPFRSQRDRISQSQSPSQTLNQSQSQLNSHFILSERVSFYECGTAALDH